MRPAAQIDKIALPIKRYLFAGRNRIDQFDFERLVALLIKLARLLPRFDFARDGQIARDDFAHALLDGFQIGGDERLRAQKIVIKAVVDHRPDGDFGFGMQFERGLRQNVGAIVAD